MVLFMRTFYRSNKLSFQIIDILPVKDRRFYESCVLSTLIYKYSQEKRKRSGSKSRRSYSSRRNPEERPRISVDSMPSVERLVETCRVALDAFLEVYPRGFDGDGTSISVREGERTSHYLFLYSSHLSLSCTMPKRHDLRNSYLVLIH